MPSCGRKSRAAELYYRRAKPEVTDFDHDLLKEELAGLEKVFPEAASALGADTPTQRVGDDRTEGFVRVKHRQAMTTLDNTYDEAELREFHARIVKALGTEDVHYTVEPKIDGVAVSLTFERGTLTRAVTRGTVKKAMMSPRMSGRFADFRTCSRMRRCRR